MTVKLKDCPSDLRYATGLVSEAFKLTGKIDYVGVVDSYKGGVLVGRMNCPLDTALGMLKVIARGRKKVTYFTECWMLDNAKKLVAETGGPPDISKHPARVERIVVWYEDHVSSYIAWANIFRKPNRLGRWSVVRGGDQPALSEYFVGNTGGLLRDLRVQLS